MLFIAAAGTSAGGIGRGRDGAIFPSSLDEVVAATGIDPDHLDNIKACDNCFRGPKVEFASYINGETSYRSGSYPETDGVGASSGAAPVVAGIAALVWSRYPNWTRDQVLQRLRESALYYGDRDGNIGYGPIDANKAVGGMYAAGIIGSRNVPVSGT